MKIKRGVYGYTIIWMHLATAAWMRVLLELGLDADAFAITSCMDGRHSPTSDHWQAKGVDYRTWTIPTEAMKKKAAKRMKEILGDDFFILLESDHLHVSYRGEVRV